jgi:hypothetical protein
VTLAGRILEKVKRFARLLKQVAAKTEDPKFKKELIEYSNILPDRAIQLKIIAAVKSSSARDESSQLSSAAQGLKVKRMARSHHEEENLLMMMHHMSLSSSIVVD